MRLEQLQAFLSVAQTGSFQQAAQKCGVTQSTISRQVQGLEAEVGLSLFHRSAHAKLTVGGERLLPHARKICQTWQNAAEELGDLLAGKQPELCVAAIHSVCAAYLPPVLQKFCRDYPNVQLRVTSLGSDRALKVLKDGLVDIAVVMNNRYFTQAPEMLVEVLYSEPIEVLMAANHPLTQYDRVPWSELICYPQVVFKDGYGMQRMVQEQFGRIGAKLHAVLELNTLDAFRGVVRQGELIALLPHSALLDAWGDRTLAIRPIASEIRNSKVSAIGQSAIDLTSCTILKNGQDAREARDEFSCGTGILPVPKKLIENGTTSAIDRTWTREVVLVTTHDRMQIPPIAHFWNLVREFVPQFDAIKLGKSGN